jgi:hypothetical protein
MEFLGEKGKGRSCGNKDRVCLINESRRMRDNKVKLVWML